MKNLILGRIWPPSGPKTSKQNYSIKKQIQLSKPDALIFCMTWKILFWAHFGSLLAHKPQIKIFPKKSFQSILSLYTTPTLWKKNQKSYGHQFSINHEKSHFGLILDPILPENPVTRFFLKGSLKYILRLYVVLTSSKKPAKLSFGPKIPGLNFFKNNCNMTSDPW